jgi:hypothetical protein
LWSEAEEQVKSLTSGLGLSGAAGTGSGSASSVEVDHIAKNVSALSREEKLRVLLNEAPELLGLLTDLPAKLKEITEFLQPMRAKIQVRGRLDAFRLKPEHVRITWTKDASGYPLTITISITGYSLDAIFSRYAFNDRPRTTVPFLGTYKS